MKIRTRIENLLISSLAVCLAIMTLMAFWLVVARYLITSHNATIRELMAFLPQNAVKATVFTTIITEELLRFALIWVGLLGSAYVFSVKQHLAFTLVRESVARRCPKIGKVLELVLHVLILGFAALVLIWGGWLMIVKNMQQLSPTLQWRMGYVYSILPLCGILIAIFEVANIHIVFRSDAGSLVPARNSRTKGGPLD